MHIKIVDTTLRDGEQKAGIALSVDDKVKIAKILDNIGIDQIEAGIPIMGDDEKKSIEKIVACNLKSKISSWNRMNIEDIKHSIDCGVDIIHMSIPSSELQIRTKLNKDRDWVKDQMRRCLDFVKSRGFEITIGFEDASRAKMDFLIELCEIALLEEVKRVRYADTVGILHPKLVISNIRTLHSRCSVDIEMHAHNDLGMAVANSIAAVEGGAQYIDCTIGGIGERAGNSNYVHFITAYNKLFGSTAKYDSNAILEAEKEIMSIVFNNTLIKEDTPF